MHNWPITISLPHGLIVSGITTWAVQMAEGLAARGRPVRIVAHDALDAHEELPQFVEGLPTGVEVIRAPDVTRPGGWAESLRIHRDLLPTILLPNILAEDYALAAALALVHPERIRVVAWNHLDNPYDYAHLAYYAPGIHRFVAMSRRCESRLLENVPARAADVACFHYGIRLPELCTKSPCEDRAIRLAYGGRMDQNHKRVFDLIDIAAGLDRRGVRFHMRLIGDGPQTRELEERARRAADGFQDGQNRIEILPPVTCDEMAAVWAWADVSLLMSNKEGFSISTLESMACGCVPIVSQCGSGVGDLIEQGHCGFTFPIGDVAAVVDHVAHLAAEPAELSRLSLAARRTAEAHGSAERFIDDVSREFDLAAGAPDRPWPATRPLQMDASEGGHSATIPHDAPERLRRVLETLADKNRGPIAVYGAGKHTRALAAVLANTPVPIVAIIEDDHNLVGRPLWGWPIIAPESAAEMGIRSVVISSWLHEADIAERRRAMFDAAGITLVRLYADAGMHAVTLASGRGDTE